MRLRPLVERFIANLVRYHGARQARSRGQRRADFQMKMCGLAFNLAQWVRLADRQPRPASTGPASTGPASTGSTT
ncbi:MAG: transposase [Caldilineales bacterium]|nr:transposase [Caldilineales bacterium]